MVFYCSCVTEEEWWEALGILAGVHSFSVGGGEGVHLGPLGFLCGVMLKSNTVH